MNKNNYNSGPFGNCERGSAGHILNAMCAWGIPLRIVENLTVYADVIKHGSEHFARYKYFDELDQPLFNFRNQDYNEPRFVRAKEDGKSVLIPKFRLMLSPHESAGLIVYGDKATPELHAFVKRTLTQFTDDPWYEVHKKACAFFQGGSHDPKEKYIYVEFWKADGAQAYIDKLNAEYRPGKTVYAYLLES